MRSFCFLVNILRLMSCIVGIASTVYKNVTMNLHSILSVSSFCYFLRKATIN